MLFLFEDHDQKHSAEHAAHSHCLHTSKSVNPSDEGQFRHNISITNVLFP